MSSRLLSLPFTRFFVRRVCLLYACKSLCVENKTHTHTEKKTGALTPPFEKCLHAFVSARSNFKMPSLIAVKQAARLELNQLCDMGGII